MILQETCGRVAVAVAGGLPQLQSATKASQALQRNVRVDTKADEEMEGGLLLKKKRKTGKCGARKAGDVEEMVSPRENSQVEEDQNDEGDQSQEEIFYKFEL